MQLAINKLIQYFTRYIRMSNGDFYEFGLADVFNKNILNKTGIFTRKVEFSVAKFFLVGLRRGDQISLLKV